MKKNIAIKLQNISKVYKLYNKPIDRLKESIHPFKKKYHKDFYALRNINLEINKGEVLGIVGVNGAGKSTLLKIIAGVMTPTTGRVQIHGKVNAILELGSSLKPEMTGRENIRLNLQINGINQDMEKITKEIIEFADIGEYIEQPIKTYSSGMIARLGFGIATSMNPDVLIVDEVLAVGDAIFARKCYGRIEKLFKDGKTVIFVSHSLQSVIEFCSRVVLLYDREIILDEEPKYVTDFYQKLIFSKKQEKVLEEMRAGINVNHDSDLREVEDELSKVIVESDKYYMPELKSSPVETKNYDVDIFDAMILDSGRKKVNVLRTGNKYTYQYCVRFNDDYFNVGFGTQIKTIKGLIINYVRTEDNRDMLKRSVKAGSEYIFKIDFTCTLLEGSYFFNAGVSVHNEGEEYYFLNRIVDAVIFNVNHVPELKIGGLVDQNYDLFVEVNKH